SGPAARTPRRRAARSARAGRVARSPPNSCDLSSQEDRGYIVCAAHATWMIFPAVRRDWPMTEFTLAATLAPPARFRPAARKPLERDPGPWALFSPRYARNLLNAIPEEAYELRYRQVRFLSLVYHGVSDPEGVKRVFLDNAANYRRPALVARMLRPVIGEGLL